MKTILIAVMLGFPGLTMALENDNIYQQSENAFAGDLTNETALAYPRDFTFDLAPLGIEKISAVVKASTNNTAAETFTDGQSSSGSITIITTTSLYGQRVSVNGVYFSFGKSIYPTDTIVAVGASTAASAANLANKIGAHASLSSIISTSTSYGVISLASKLADGVDYPLTTTSQSIVALGGASMDGGIAATVGVNDIITIANTALTTGMKVALTGSNLPTGLSATDYWVIKLTANTIKLAANKVNALAGTPVNITAVPVGTSANTYTLTPAAMAGSNATMKWQVSNDGVNFLDLATSAIFVSSNNAAGYTKFDFSDVNYRYLNLNVSGLTTGSILLNSEMYMKRSKTN